MIEQCEYCWKNFTDYKYLERHKQVAKYCSNYKYVNFTCIKCNFTTRGIKNIDRHVKDCNNNTVLQSENSFEDLVKRIKELEGINETNHVNISRLEICMKSEEHLKSLLKLESFKNKIFRHIIEQNTSIRIDDVFVEEEDGIHVYNTHGGSIPIFIHEHLKNEVGISVQQLLTVKKTVVKEQVHDTITDKTQNKKARNKDNPKLTETLVPSEISELIENVKSPMEKETIEKDNVNDRKQTFRSVKSAIVLVPEITQEIHIVKNLAKDRERQTIIEKFGELPETLTEFDKIFDKLRKSRVYTKIMNELYIKRWSIFGRISFESYQELLTNQIHKIETIFRDKNYSEKKSTTIISKGLSALEGRIVNYGNYTTTHLDIDEIQRLEIVLEITAEHPKEYVPCNIEKLCKNFYNYGVVILQISKNLVRYLFNIYGYHNIIYLPLPKNSDEDPFSYYILERVNKDKRYWKMDCRLQYTSSGIIVHILPYLISMFRKLYRDVFGDNDFRKDYTYFSQLTECDCEQLLQNIILMGQPKEFCNILRKIVKQHATYEPTVNDKFNLYGDDALQRKRFQEREDIELVDIIKQLFDGISSEDAIDFYRFKLVN